MTGSRIAALVAVLLAVTVAPASADTERGHVGDVGRHYLRDTPSRAGVRCADQEPGRHGPGLLVAPPVVYGTRDRQPVGHGSVLQKREGTGERWRSILVITPVRTVYASEDEPARWGWSIAPIEDLDADYRLFHTFYWYNAGEVVGIARHRVDWYYDEDTDSVGHFCRYRGK